MIEHVIDICLVHISNKITCIISHESQLWRHTKHKMKGDTEWMKITIERTQGDSQAWGPTEKHVNIYHKWQDFEKGDALYNEYAYTYAYAYS